MDSSPPYVVIELDTAGSDDDYIEFFTIEDTVSTSEEDSSSEVSFPPRNRGKDLGAGQSPLQVMPDDAHGMAEVMDCHDEESKASHDELPNLCLANELENCLIEDFQKLKNEESNVCLVEDSKIFLKQSQDCEDEQFELINKMNESDTAEVTARGVSGSISNTDGKEWFAEMMESNDWLEEQQLKVDYKTYNEGIIKDIVERILKRVVESEWKDRYAEILESNDWLEEQQLKVDDKTYKEGIVKGILEGILERVAESDCKDVSAETKDSKTYLGGNSKGDDTKYKDGIAITEEILKQVDKWSFKDKNVEMLESIYCSEEHSNVDDTKYEQRSVEYILEKILNKVAESDYKDKNTAIVGSEDCFHEQLKTGDEIYGDGIVKDTVERIVKRVAENDCEDACIGKKAKYSTSVEKMETENQPMPIPTLNSTDEASESHVWSGYVCLKDCSIPTQGYCIRGDKKFAANLMSTMETMPIILKEDSHITKQKLWDIFKDESRFTSVLGLNEGTETPDEVEQFNRCFVNEDKYFHRVFSPLATPNVLYNVYIFKIDFKAKVYVEDINPGCKLICTNKSYFLLVSGRAGKHEVERYLPKSN